MMSFVFSLIWTTGIFAFYPAKVAFDILNHLTGRSKSTWCQSGGLRKPRCMYTKGNGEKIFIDNNHAFTFIRLIVYSFIQYLLFTM